MKKSEIISRQKEIIDLYQTKDRIQKKIDNSYTKFAVIFDLMERDSVRRKIDVLRKSFDYDFFK
jgi:hypothetical protein